MSSSPENQKTSWVRTGTNQTSKRHGHRRFILGEGVLSLSGKSNAKFNY